MVHKVLPQLMVVFVNLTHVSLKKGSLSKSIYSFMWNMDYHKLYVDVD